ncbi:hypothetical protein L5515_010997 [Caenorhabditis briggsae]|uniref:Uncharacterized protein n=1 Tax=Caenorhabditis briggsae TaxID=6238 RepID=A0AAE9ENP0_CAEBR|nr:hypothetical protein L5515_010997 [Caenorhabditis briggsae]
MVLHRFLRDVESRNILLQYEFHKKNSPRLAHQNLCQMTSWKKIVEQEEKPYCRWDRIPLFDDTTTSRFKQDKEEEEKEDPVPEEEKEFDISKAYYKEESISFEKVSFIFKEFRNGNFEVEPILHPILKDLSEDSVEYIGLSSIPRFTKLHHSNKCYHFAMTHLKLVTHGASILKLVTFHEEEPNSKLRIEYWQTRDGCFVWCGHDVKFVEKKFHYTLATIDFMIATRYMSRPLVEIDFDIQQWNGWDCRERPDLGFVWTVWDTFLYNKSLNIHAEIFRMTVSKTDRDEKRLSLIRFVKPRLLEVIILKVWDDRHMGCKDKDEPFKFKDIYNTKQWKRAFCVDIRDKMIQKNFSAYPGFQQIQMTMKEEELMDLKEGVFFAIHIVSFAGLGTVVRMGIQPKQYTLAVDYTESLGTARTMFVMGCFIFIETVNAVNSPRFRYFECPESWLVVVEDISFKLMVFSHSIAYFVVKSMWSALRAEKLSICKNEKVVGKLVKRENAWIELYDTPH